MASRSFFSRLRFRLPSRPIPPGLGHGPPPPPQLWQPVHRAPTLSSFQYRPFNAPQPFQVVTAAGRRTMATLIESPLTASVTRVAPFLQNYSRLVARAFGSRMVAGTAAVGLAVCLTNLRYSGIYARECEEPTVMQRTHENDERVLSDPTLIVGRTPIARVLLAPRSAADELAAVRVERRILCDRVNDLRLSEERSRANAAAANASVQELQAEVEALRAQLCAERKRFRDKEKLLEDALHEASVTATCVVCLDTPRNVVFGCGHHVACQGCAERLSRCPMCRADVDELIVHFVS